MRWRTYSPKFRNIVVPVPPLSDQDQIVRFLDWKTSKINLLISNHKKHISLLESMKLDTIDQCTIHGIRNEALKYNEGSRWDIDYPKTWKIARLKECFSFRKGLSITKANLTPSGVSVINYGQIHAKTNTGVALNNDLMKFVSDEYLNTAPNALVQKGDFIFADTSEDLAGCGNCAYIDWADKIFAGYHSIIMHSTQEQGTRNKYFAYLFKSPTWRTQVRKRVNAVKVYSITQQILKDMFLLIPPQSEQSEIVEYLDLTCAKIDTLIEKEHAQIQQLHDMKNTLISDVVTGKIDVRNVEIPDYEYIEEEDDITDDIEDDEELSEEE